MLIFIGLCMGLGVYNCGCPGALIFIIEFTMDADKDFFIFGHR